MVFALASLLAAQIATAAAPHITVTGRATLAVEPERAEVRIGVVTDASEAQEAARRNAEKLDAALRALKQALGDSAKFETTSYSLRPVYRRPEPREAPILEGYTATNVLRVYDLPLDGVGRAIDVATSAGANTIEDIGFSLRDETAVKERALREAAANARAKADALADALGVRIVRILEVSEGEADVVRPMPAYRAQTAMAQAEMPTPVEAGSIEVRASVTLVVEIEP
jgi:uncharacterized protein YggE